MKKRIIFIIFVLVITLMTICLFLIGNTEEQIMNSINRSSVGSKTKEKEENNPPITTSNTEKILDKELFKSLEGSIVAGRDHTAALKADGTVAVAGGTSYDQTHISKWTDIVSIVSGDDFVAGLKADGTVVVAGNTAEWQEYITKWTDIVYLTAKYDEIVGIKSDGTIVSNYGEMFGYPKKKRKRSFGKEIRSVAIGGGYKIYLKKNGTVKRTGSNSYGQISLEEFTDIVAIDTQNFTTAGLKSDGTVVFTGYCANAGYWEDAESWTDIVSISVGSSHIVGLKSDGTVVAAGKSSEFGQTQVSEWSDIVAISAGTFHTVGLKCDGTVVSTRISPDTDLELKDWNNITSIECGLSHLVGLRSDGTGVAVGIIWDSDTELAMDSWKGLIAITDWEGIKSDGTVVPIVKSDPPYHDQSKLIVANTIRPKGTEKDGIRTIWVRDGYNLELKQDGTINLTGPNKHIIKQISDWTDVTDISSSENLIAGLKSDGTVVLEVWYDFGQADVGNWTDIGFRNTRNQIE